jgi:hypothetical protein
MEISFTGYPKANAFGDRRARGDENLSLQKILLPPRYIPIASPCWVSGKWLTTFGKDSDNNDPVQGW